MGGQQGLGRRPGWVTRAAPGRRQDSVAVLEGTWAASKG